MILPKRIRDMLRNRENGHDIIGITVTLATVKRVIAWFRQKRRIRREKRR